MTDWDKIEIHVLSELKRGAKAQEDMGDNFEKLRKTVADGFADVRVEVAMLKVKSSLWGGVAGGAAGIMGVVIAYFIERGIH